MKERSMRFPTMFLGLAAASLLATGCAKQEDPAIDAVTSAEAAVAELRIDAAKFAPEELKGVESKLAALKNALAKEHYKSVLAGTSEINAAVNTLKETITSRQTQIQAATNEWTDLSAEVPQLVDAIQSRVDSLSVSGRLPETVKQETFETAKVTLESMKSMWTEASNAFSAGNATEAADKARMVKAKAEELRQQLAMPLA
jgi:hypothetical protein